MQGNVVPFGLSRPAAQELIHRLSEQDAYVIEPVCITKMRDRDFDIRQVMETLKTGTVNQGPARDECGDWRCRMKKRVAGKLVRVVVAIHNLNFLYVISIH